jgi:hypothetical protein
MKPYQKPVFWYTLLVVVAIGLFALLPNLLPAATYGQLIQLLVALVVSTVVENGSRDDQGRPFYLQRKFYMAIGGIAFVVLSGVIPNFATWIPGVVLTPELVSSVVWFFFATMLGLSFEDTFTRLRAGPTK